MDSRTWKRTPRVPLALVPKSTFPKHPIPEGLDIEKDFSSLIQLLNSQVTSDIFRQDESLWRDIWALTGTMRTFVNKERIVPAWKELVAARQASDFTYIPGSAHRAPIGPFVFGKFTFQLGGTHPGHASGVLNAVADENGQLRIWFFVTYLEQLDGFGNPEVLDKVNQPNGIVNDSANGHVNGISNTNSNGANSTDDQTLLDVAIVGAGQSSLSTLGRLKALGITNTVALERNDTIGGNWTGRYDNVKLHTGKYYATLPFGKTFHGDEWPYHLRARDIAKGYQQYVADYGLNVQLSTTVTSAKWNEASADWTIYATRKSGEEVVVRARHVVFAIGQTGGFPYMPSIPNKNAYTGVVMHSASFSNAESWEGKRGIVIGTANSGHDVAESFVEAKLASTTMVQRGSCMHIPIHWFNRIHTKGYHKDADVYESDHTEWGLPSPAIGAISRTIFSKWSQEDASFHEALHKRGFQTTLPDAQVIHERGGGHYLDVGASQKIIDGLIDVKGGEIDSFTPTGLKFKDGSTLDAELIVFATGFHHNLREQVTAIVGPEVGERLEDCGFYDAECELRGAWKPHNRKSPTPHVRLTSLIRTFKYRTEDLVCIR